MKRFGLKPGIGLLVGLLSVATFMAAPASAAHHHHHHHHHTSGGGGVTCGPGTVKSGGMCVPTGPTGPTGNSNVAITPSSVTMNLDGTLTSSVVVTGLPPQIPVLATPDFIPCGPFGGDIEFDLGNMTDALGRVQGTLFNNDPAEPCVPGTFPVIIGETVSPFQSFTGFITLHF